MTVSTKPNTWLRIASLLLEWFIMFAIVMLFSFPAMDHDSFGLFRVTHEPYKLQLLNDPWVYLGMFGFSLVFFKDCINGQSFAKRIIKIQVVDNATGAAASPMQCFTRNVCLLLFPFEVLAVLAEPDRRIGDKVAGTRIVVYNPDTNNKTERSIKKYIAPLLLSYIVPVALAFLLGTVSFNKSATAFVTASYNEQKSRSLQTLLNNNFNQYYTASVKYYDSIENKNFDYVSMICQLKNAEQKRPGLTYSELESQTVSMVYSLFPQEQLHGKIRFVYRETNSITTWNHIFGIRFDGDAE